MEEVKVRPSSVARITKCNGSLLEENGLPDVENKYSSEGTKIHEFAREILEGGNPSLLELTAPSKKILERYISFANKAIDGKPFFVEQSVEVSVESNVPPIKGTADLVVVDGTTIKIIDLKCGHKKVSAQNNPQLLLYALGACSLDWAKLEEVKKIQMTIVQPALSWIDTEEITIEQAQDRLAEIKKTLEVSLNPATAYKNPSEEACRYCKARLSCLDLRQHMIMLYKVGLDQVESKKGATHENKKKLLLKFPFIKKYYNDLKEHITQKVINGDEFSGYKLNKGTTRRKWLPEAKGILLEKIGKEVLKQKLRPISELKEIIEKDDEFFVIEKAPRGKKIRIIG